MDQSTRTFPFPVKQARQVNIFFAAFLIACLPFNARAKNIFDDDWPTTKPAVPRRNAPEPLAPVFIPPAPAANSTTPTPPPVRRHGVPAPVDQARSRRLLKEAFAEQLKDRSISGRRKLAQLLLDEVSKTSDNPTDQFVLLFGSIEASQDASDLPLCFQAIDTMASQYEVDGLSLKTDAVTKANLRGDSPASAARNAQAALDLIDPLLASDDISEATKILGLIRPLTAGDPTLAQVVQKRGQFVEAVRVVRLRVTHDTETLKKSPDDPAANLSVGKYLSFTRGEWEKGLPMLAKGPDADLRSLALLELSRPSKADQIIVLGDRWWDVGAKQPDTIRVGIEQHAATFYKLALESASGLQRTLIEHRVTAAAEAAASLQTGDAISSAARAAFTNSIGMKFVLIKAGEFMMGSPDTEAGHKDEETLHHIKITKPFLMATTPVTQAQWKAVMASDISFFHGDDLPVEQVLWTQAREFCTKLSAKEGKHYRLPTEAEWEFACRAGTQTEYGGSTNLDELGWYPGNSDNHTHPVGQKKPNPWGLYDMHGNVWQWCSDDFGPYSGDAVDPKGSGDASKHPMRGGSFSNGAKRCRAAFRLAATYSTRANDFGFRVCLDY